MLLMWRYLLDLSGVHSRRPTKKTDVFAKNIPAEVSQIRNSILCVFWITMRRQIPKTGLHINNTSACHLIWRHTDMKRNKCLSSTCWRKTAMEVVKPLEQNRRNRLRKLSLWCRPGVCRVNAWRWLLRTKTNCTKVTGCREEGQIVYSWYR
jgi:hypothetical protein